MADEATLSEETMLLAEIFGAVLGGIALELKVAGAMPPPAIEAMLNKGIGRARGGFRTPDQQAKRDAIITALLKSARI